MRIKNKSFYILNIDGTGYFRSDKVGFDSCLSYKSSETRKALAFGNNMLGASLAMEGKNGPEEQKRHLAWVTDLKVNKDTVVQIMKGGRARWKIEDETFNTLKN